MPALKYTALTKILLEAIQNGTYTNRLPPVRTICQTYKVSRNTVTMAAGTLTRLKIITPGSHGTLINRRKVPCCSKRIVVVTPKALNPCIDDILVNQLNLLVTSEGYEFLLHVLNRDPLPDALGYIFIYSSFNAEMIKPLNHNHNPFVVANRCPESYNVNCVDWNHRREFDDIIRMLIDEGSRNIAVFCPTTINSSLMLEDFIAVKKEYSMSNRALDQLLRQNYYKAEDFLDALRTLSHVPDTVISFWNSDIFTTLVRERLPEWAGKIRVYGANVGHHYCCTDFMAIDYKLLAQKSWKLLQRILYDPFRSPTQVKLIPPLILQDKSFASSGKKNLPRCPK